jgi:cellulose synthase/poly-beta-1,6-N-acetylglucosamine synthase-like glycosyltransferase
MEPALLVLAYIALALAGLYAVVTLANLAIFRAPRRDGRPSGPVSILIPARDEADNIAAVLESVLAQTGVELEVVVLDDGSSDGTAAIVERLAAADPRLRVIHGANLPAGWNGKQHACHQLA